MFASPANISGAGLRAPANIAGYNGMVARGLSIDASDLTAAYDYPNNQNQHHQQQNQNQYQLQQQPQQQRSKVAGRTMMLGEMDEHKMDLAKIPNTCNNTSNKLSDLHSFVRLHCIEVFACTAEDVEKHPRSKGTRRARLGQVGLRCVHCKHLPLRELANQSISFPTSTAHIYESVRNWHRFHFDLCQHIPADIRAKYTALKRGERAHKTGRFATKDYFTEGARRLGMRDTRSGIFFADDDVALRNIHLNLDNQLPVTHLSGERTMLVRRVLDRAVHRPHCDQLVLREHRKFVTDCTWLLYCQLQTCAYRAGTNCNTNNNNNNNSNSNNGNVSSANLCHNEAPRSPLLRGLECRHCMAENKQDRHGRYYPSTEKKLSDASFSQCVYLHMIKCEMCPQDVKRALEGLHMLNAMQRAQLKRGSKKRFFSIIWQKMLNNHNNKVVAVRTPPLPTQTPTPTPTQAQLSAAQAQLGRTYALQQQQQAALYHPHGCEYSHLQQQQQQQMRTGNGDLNSYARQLTHPHPQSHLMAHAANNINMNVNVNMHAGSMIGEDDAGSNGTTPEEREDAKLIIQFATARS